MKKLLASIYYQDCDFSNNVVVNPEKSTFIVQFCFDPEKENRDKFCERCYEYMNNLNIPVGHKDRPIFEKAGHTSMSVGDYIKFEDGEIRICRKGKDGFHFAKRKRIGQLKTVVGDVTNPQRTESNEVVVIPHCCNNKKVMGAGVALALKKKWGSVEYFYQKGSTDLGTVTYAIMFDDDGGTDIVVANMIGQDGTASIANKKPVKYRSLAIAMHDVMKHCIRFEKANHGKNVAIHCPKFGSDLAGGDWSIIMELIKEIWLENGIDVVVYEF